MYFACTWIILAATAWAAGAFLRVFRPNSRNGQPCRLRHHNLNSPASLFIPPVPGTEPHAMIDIGKFNTLTIRDISDRQILLAGDDGDIPLIDREPPAGLAPGQTLQVFVYPDGSGQLQATQQQPRAQVDEVAWLRVVEVGHAGAFLDWGLPKDLLVPYSEQKVRMVVGRSYLVRLFLDESNRVAATTHLDDFIQDQAFYYKAGQTVQLIIAEETDLGYKAVVDHRYWGMLYHNEIFQPLRKGQQLTGYIRRVREDQRLDLTLHQGSHGGQVAAAAEKILATLHSHGGYMALTDKTPPETIYSLFGVSKKIFKQAVGGLYRQRRIVIEDAGIRLAPPAP